MADPTHTQNSDPFQHRKAKLKENDWKRNSIRFADNNDALATTTYCYSLSYEDRELLTRRIVAALNATSNYSTEELEKLTLNPDRILTIR